MGMDVHGLNPRQNKKLSDFDTFKSKLKDLGFTDEEINFFNLKNIK